MERIRYQRSGSSLRDVVIVFFMYRKAVVLTFLLVLIIGSAFVLNMTPLYEAKSTLLLKIGREYLNRTDLNSATPMMSVSEGEIINSEIHILTNEVSIQKAILAVGLARMYPELAKGKLKPEDGVRVAAERFQKVLTVEPVKQSNVIEVSLKHRDPVLAAQAVNALVELFKEKHIQVFSGPKFAFVEAQLAQYQKKMDRADQNLENFKQRNKVFSLTEQRTLLLQQRYALDAELKKTEAEVRELQDKVPALKHSLDRIGHTAAPSVEKETKIEESRAKLLSMQLEEQQLLKKYTETNPLVVSFRREMAVVRDFIREQERAQARSTSHGSPFYQTVQMELVKAQVDLASVRARAGTLREQLRQCDSDVQNLDMKERTLQQLKLEQTVDQKNYEMLLAKAEEARMSESMDKNKLANVSVIQQATPPSEPVEPKKSQYLLRCLLFAIAASLAVPFAIKGISPRLTTPEAVEQRLGLKVLATISHTENS